MPIDLSDDELIDVPTANLRPGELARAFAVQAERARKRQEDTVSELGSLTALQRRHEEEDHEQREFEQREEALLAKLREREREILEEAEQLDARTIKLDDGRRAYVDRDTYRDAEGRELDGADRAQAEQHHLDQPNAATWEEHREIEQKLKATQQLREKVEALGAKNDAPDASKTLARYESAYQAELATAKDGGGRPSDYGSGDYMAAMGLSGSFTQATRPGAGNLPSLPTQTNSGPKAAALTLPE